MAKSTAPKKAMTEKDLQAKLAELKAELLVARQAGVAGELVNPRVITKARKDIARVMTQLNNQPTVKEEEKN